MITMLLEYGPLTVRWEESFHAKLEKTFAIMKICDIETLKKQSRLL